MQLPLSVAPLDPGQDLAATFASEGGRRNGFSTLHLCSGVPFCLYHRPGLGMLLAGPVSGAVLGAAALYASTREAERELGSYPDSFTA